MIKYKKQFLLLPIKLLSAAILLTACSNGKAPNPNLYNQSVEDDSSQINTLSDEEQPLSSEVAPPAALKGTRDNTPDCLIPSADGILTFGNDVVVIDISHTESGYIMVQYLGNVSKVKLQITGPNQITYTYNLSSSYEAFPLVSGNGNYSIAVYENIQADQYATAYDKTIAVEIENEFLPYLYASQYVNFNESSQCIKLAEELAAPANNDLEVVSSVFNFITENITYDYSKAETVQSGYIPELDSVLTAQTGICFDYASLMAAMLRSQRIPTRLEIGYVGEAYHAWISTYITDVGWVNGIIEFDGNDWTLMDPTFAANSSEDALKDFIGDGTNYMTKYVY